jgi:hypothetical protein
MLRLLVGLCLTWTSLLAAAGPAHAQRPYEEPPIRLEADGTPLADVLRTLALQTGVDIVFAERTVAGLAITGRYIGDDLEGALRTVLRSSGLRAEQVRPRQYVVVPNSGLGVTVPQPAARGTLEGVVVDAASGEVLPGAHVVLAGLHLGTVTNTAGYFAIAGLPAGTYGIRVTYVGYRGAEVEVPVYPGSKLDRPTIALAPQAINSPTVVIVGNDVERGDLEIVPGTARVGVRTAAALPAVLGEGDLFSALEWVPGVTRAGETGGELVVRGAESQYNRYYLDGAPVLHPWHAFGLFSIFQPEALKAVRLHKGSFPAEHGGGLAAVLDVEMRDGERERIAGMFAVSPVSIRGVLEAPVGDHVSVVLVARRTWLDMLLAPRLRLSSRGGGPSFSFDNPFSGEDRDESQDIGYHFFDAGGKVTWRFADGHRASVTLYEGGDRLAADGLRLVPRNGSASGEEAEVELDYSWGNRVLSARYHGLIGRRLFVTTTAYYSSYRAREISSSQVDAVEADYRLRLAEAGLRVDADFYYSLSHQLRAGLHVAGRDFEGRLREDQVTDDGTLLLREQRDGVQTAEVVAYVQDTWQPAAGWQIQPGLRMEYFGLGSYLSINPRLHLRRTLSRDRLYLRAGLSRQTQPLHRLRDRAASTYDLAADRWLLASEHVAPAVAWQAAVGVEWLPLRRLTLSAELWGRRLSDVLLPADPLAPRAGSWPAEGFAPGTGRAAGLELSAELEGPRWRSGLSYSLSQSEERAAGAAYRAARYDAPHQIEAYVVTGLGPWTAALTSTVRSGYPIASLVPRSTEPTLGASQAPAGRLPVYARVDLALGYAFDLFGLQWDAQAQAYNLLNRRNTVGIVGPTDVAAPAGTDISGLPILPMVSLKARW